MITKAILLLIFNKKYIKSSLIDNKIRTIYFMTGDIPKIFGFNFEPTFDHEGISISIKMFNVLTEIKNPYKDHEEFLSIPFKLLKDLSVKEDKSVSITNVIGKMKNTDYFFEIEGFDSFTLEFDYNDKHGAIDSIKTIKIKNNKIYDENDQIKVLYDLYDIYLFSPNITYLGPIDLFNKGIIKKKIQIRFKRQTFAKRCSRTFMEFVELEILQDGQNSQIKFVNLSDFFNNRNEKDLSILKRYVLVHELNKTIRIGFQLEQKDNNEGFILLIYDFKASEMPLSVVTISSPIIEKRYNKTALTIAIIVVLIVIAIIIVVFVFRNLNIIKKKRKFVNK